MIKIIGITMRVDKASGYSELRDALAHDWQSFMKYALPEVSWLPIPNIEEEVILFIKKWGIQGIILSGGNDIDTCKKRDVTEKAILRYSISRRIPVFGVCRGLQMIQQYFRGSILKCPKNTHVRKKHLVIVDESQIFKSKNKYKVIVNSYHRYGVRTNTLNNKLIPFAVTQDGWVEGLKAKNLPILAMQWHPERERPFRKHDRAIIRNFFDEQKI